MRPPCAKLSEAITAVYGTDFGLRGATSISQFSDAARQAESYRDRRVLLAGDAAHVHYPMGGQGLGTGVQDAVNLGWKLAQVISGTSPDSLLDSYHAERHPVAARVLQNTMAQAALTRTDPRTDALRDTMSELLSMDEPRKRIARDDVSGWTFTMTSARGTRWSGGACPTLTWSPQPVRCGPTPCSTTPGRCCSTLVRRRQPRHRRVDGQGPANRRAVRRPVEAARAPARSTRPRRC